MVSVKAERTARTNGVHQQTGVQEAMQAIDLEASVGDNQELHLKLPGKIEAARPGC